MNFQTTRVDEPFVTAILRNAGASEALGHWRDARNQHELALHRLFGDADPRVAARVVRRVARCLIEEAQMDAAFDALTVARTTSEMCDDIAGVAHTINLEGIIAQLNGDLRGAEDAYRRARAIASHAGDVSLCAMIDQNLGTIANMRGDFIEARLRYEASLAAYRTLDLQPAVGPLLNNLGILHTHLGHWHAASRYYNAARKHALAAGSLTEQLRTETNRAEMYVARGKFRKARRVARRVLALARTGESEGAWLEDALRYSRARPKRRRGVASAPPRTVRSATST